MTRRSAALAALLLAATARAADLPEGHTHDFPVAGISLRIPEASSLANTLPAGVLFDYWAQDGTLGATAMLVPVTNPSADQYASQLALQLHGIKQAWDDTIDGEPAFRINIPVNVNRCTARTSLVAVHKNRALVITAFAADNDKSEEAARRLARSASFSDPDAPADHIDFSTKTGFAFGEPAARVVISAPEWLHVVKTAGKQATLTGFDFNTGKEPFIAALTYTDVPPTMHAGEFAARMTPQMKARFGVNEKELWSTLTDDGRFYVTPVLKPLMAAAGAPTAYKIALIEVAPGHMLNLAFIINTDDDDQKRAYADLATAIIKNVKFASAPPAAFAPAGPPAQASADDK